MKKRNALGVFTLLLLLSGCSKEEKSILGIDVKQTQTDTTMALPLTDLSLAAIRDALGETTTDLHVLYNSPKINQWAACKPRNSSSPSWGSGLKRQTTAPYKCYWDKPTGATGDQLAHFRGYNHAAKPPVDLQLTDVKIPMTGTSIWNGGAPILFVGGFYRFSFTFKQGDTNPNGIDNATGWEKLTANSGTGGVLFCEDSAETVFDSSRVFSVPTTAQVISDETFQVQSLEMPFFAYYATRNQNGTYGKTKLIENTHPLLPDNITPTWHQGVEIRDNPVEWMTDEQDGDYISEELYSQMRWTDDDDFVTGTWYFDIWAYDETTQQVMDIDFVYFKWKVDGVWDTTWETFYLDSAGAYEMNTWIEFHNNTLIKIPFNGTIGHTYTFRVAYYDATGLLNATKEYSLSF